MATDDITMPPHEAISPAPRDVDAIQAQEKASILRHWNADVAFTLGYKLRTRLLTHARPAVVQISTLSTPPHVLFHAVTHSGTALDNDFWVARKRAAVIRFHASTWRLHHQFGGDEAAFAAKNGLGAGAASEYAIHGGGVPVYVAACDGPVAVVVVSGLKQWDDHQVVMEELGKLAREMEGGKGGV